MHRYLFCAFWLYFYGFRAILGSMRFMDYIGISFLLVGLLGLISKKKISFRIVMQVLMMFSPIIISAIVNPNSDVLFFLLKMYVITLYFVCYFKSMRLTSIELACFTFPVVISVYYFLNPITPAESRLSGLGDPNFTSLSLIISMCSAFGIYILSKKKLVNVLMIIVISICCWGVLLTASRAGFIGVIIALCLFLAIKKSKWYTFSAVVAAAIIVAFNSDVLIDITNRFFVFERFQALSSGHGSLLETIGTERSFTELAWDTVRSGEWFIGGGPRLVIEWAEMFRYVPHNSLLDIGLAFGKASFYFYSGLIVVLFIVNVLSLLKNQRNMNNTVKDNLLTSLLFLSLIPMYMSLSVGLTMSFILWMVFGTYPLLHPSPKHAKGSSIVSIFRRIKL